MASELAIFSAEGLPTAKRQLFWLVMCSAAPLSCPAWPDLSIWFCQIRSQTRNFFSGKCIFL